MSDATGLQANEAGLQLNFKAARAGGDEHGGGGSGLRATLLGGGAGVGCCASPGSGPAAGLEALRARWKAFKETTAYKLCAMAANYAFVVMVRVFEILHAGD